MPLYALSALSVMNEPATIVTKVAAGDEELLAGFRSPGADLHWRPARSTATFRLDHDGERRELVIDDVGDGFTASEIDGWVRTAVSDCAGVHLGALSRADFPASAPVSLTADRLVSVDGQGLARPGRIGPVVRDPAYDPQGLDGVDVLKLSTGEATALGLELTQPALRSLGVPEVIVTLGSEGALVSTADELTQLRAQPVANVDPTGSGDRFAAAYLTSRLRDHSPLEAAHAAVSISTQALRQQLDPAES